MGLMCHLLCPCNSPGYPVEGISVANEPHVLSVGMIAVSFNRVFQNISSLMVENVFNEKRTKHSKYLLNLL